MKDYNKNENKCLNTIINIELNHKIDGSVSNNINNNNKINSSNNNKEIYIINKSNEKYKNINHIKDNNKRMPVRKSKSNVTCDCIVF